MDKRVSANSTSTALVLSALLSSLFIFGICAYGGADEADSPKIEVVLIDGSTRVLSAPINVDGYFSTSEFVIKAINTPILIGMTRESGNGSSRLVVSFRGGEQPVTVTADSDAKITGTGEWGRESISFDRVRSLSVSHTAEHSSFQAEHEWLCRLASGRELTIGWDSEWELEDSFRGTVGEVGFDLSPSAIRRMSLEGRVADVLYPGDYRLSKWKPAGETLATNSSLGALEIGWDAVKLLENQKLPEENAGFEARYRLLTTGGTELQLPKLSAGPIAGKLKDASVELDLGAIRSVERADEEPASFSITFAGGVRVDHFWPPDQAEFSAESPAGSISIPWGMLKAMRQDDTEESLVESRGTWHLLSKQGLDLPLENLKAGEEAMVNSEIQVVDLRWDRVAAAVSTLGGLRIRLANSAEWSLSGGLAAHCPYGEVTFDCDAVAELKRTDDALDAGAPTDEGEPVVGKVRTTRGGEYFAASPELIGENRAIDDSGYSEYDLFVIEAPPGELWVGSTVLLESRIVVADGLLVSEHPMVSKLGPLSGFKGVSFKNFAGEFFAPIGVMREYVPQAKPSVSRRAGEVKFRLSVEGTSGKTSFDASKIEFARYPLYGWSGWYSKWDYPFQWQRSDNLLFKRQDDGSQVDAEFEKLRRIALEGEYGSDRRATLTSSVGNEMKGSIYPGDVGESHGVSTWDPDKEGLLCRIEDDAYVFVRFAKVRAIEISSVPAE